MSDRRGSPIPDSIFLDSLFRLVRHPHRRTVLSLLIEDDWALTTNDLTKEIAMREHDESIAEIPTDEVTHLYLSLFPCHIPKLADTELIEYDAERRIVEPTETLDQFRSFFSLAVEIDERTGE